MNSLVRWLQSLSPKKFTSSVRYTISTSYKISTFSVQWIQDCKHKLGLHSVQAMLWRSDIQGSQQGTVCWCNKRDIGKRYCKHPKKRYGLGVLQSENNFQNYLDDMNDKVFDLPFFFKSTNQAVSNNKVPHQTFSEEIMRKFPKWSKAIFLQLCSERRPTFEFLPECTSSHTQVLFLSNMQLSHP